MVKIDLLELEPGWYFTRASGIYGVFKTFFPDCAEPRVVMAPEGFPAQFDLMRCPVPGVSLELFLQVAFHLSRCADSSIIHIPGLIPGLYTIQGMTPEQIEAVEILAALEE